jgi:carboxylesterase type B
MRRAMRRPAQVRAVRRNITAATVGCDASRVTILGESAHRQNGFALEPGARGIFRF